MAQDTFRPRRIVAKTDDAEPSKGGEGDKVKDSKKVIRHTITLPMRTSGLLAYYAQTRGLSESMVVNQSLRLLFKGLRIADPGANAGEEEEAA